MARRSLGWPGLHCSRLEKRMKLYNRPVLALLLIEKVFVVMLKDFLR